MVMHILQGVAILLLPARKPQHFEAAGYKLSQPFRVFWGVGLIMLASLFILSGLSKDSAGGVVYLIACSVGAIGYFVRRAMLRARGLSIEELLLHHAARALQPAPARASSP